MCVVVVDDGVVVVVDVDGEERGGEVCAGADCGGKGAGGAFGFVAEGVVPPAGRYSVAPVFTSTSTKMLIVVTFFTTVV